VALRSGYFMGMVMTAVHTHCLCTQAPHSRKRPQEPEGLKVKATKWVAFADVHGMITGPAGFRWQCWKGSLRLFHVN
jgi:hypothetical protein